jgi:hypothetical protein
MSWIALKRNIEYCLNFIIENENTQTQQRSQRIFFEILYHFVDHFVSMDFQYRKAIIEKAKGHLRAAF